LLLLRLWLGLTLLFNHGLGKLLNFESMSAKFLNLFGLGSKTSLALAIFGEFLCAALLAVGLLTGSPLSASCSTCSWPSPWFTKWR
jgi:putative oxidoreductase